MSTARWLSQELVPWLLLAVCTFVTPAHAQVIEISSDGTATTYSKPTRFIAGEVGNEVRSAIVDRGLSIDRFERAARAEGLDVHLLRAVAWTESRGRQSAVSRKGALGVMQLMPGTAAELGVDPLDADANLHGGARYLALQLSRFRSVPLALAAYNAGPNAVTRWGGIPPYAETRAYVSQIMARYQGSSVSLAPKLGQRATPVRPVNSMLIEVPSL